jgi:hypothetical protein
MGAASYRSTDGAREVIPSLCAHRRVRATDCPGRGIVDLLPELRVAVAQRIASRRRPARSCARALDSVDPA